MQCRQRGKCPSFIQIHNGWGVVISVSFAVIVYASCDLLHSINATVYQKKTYIWRLAEYLLPPTLLLSPSLSLSLPPSFLPSLAGGDSEPAYKLRLADDPAPFPFPSPLPSRRRKGTSPHSKVDRRSCSTSPSLPLSLLLSLPPSPSLPSYRVGGDKEPAHKLRFAENPAPSSSLSLPLPSFVGRDREPGHTLKLREDRGLKRLLGMAMKQSSSRRPRVSGTNLLASLYVHKLVGQPVCTQTCWPACIYTQQSTWVQVICSQVCHSLDTSNPCCEIPSRKCPGPQIMFYLALSRHNTHPANCCIIHNVHKYLFITV